MESKEAVVAIGADSAGLEEHAADDVSKDRSEIEGTCQLKAENYQSLVVYGSEKSLLCCLSSFSVNEREALAKKLQSPGLTHLNSSTCSSDKK